MKLKKFIKHVETITKVIIWTQYNTEETGPDWEGWLIDIPHKFLKYKIGFGNEEDNKYEYPIHICTYRNQHNNYDSALVINLIAP